MVCYLLFPETLISPEVFAEVLCDDLDLPAASFVPAVVQAIRQQIKQFDTDSEISLDQQTDQRVTIKVQCKKNIFLSVKTDLKAFNIKFSIESWILLTSFVKVVVGH